MRYILWIVGLIILVGGAFAAGCEETLVRSQPYYYSEDNPYFDFYYGEPDYYIYGGHRGERYEWMEDRGHEGGEHHEGGAVHGGGEFHGGGGGHGGHGR